MNKLRKGITLLNNTGLVLLLASMVLLLTAAVTPVVYSGGVDLLSQDVFTLLDQAYCSGEMVHPIGESIAETFDISYEEVMHFYCQGSDFEDVLLALETASESKVPVSVVIESRQQQEEWDQIWQENKTLLVGCGNSVEEKTAEEIATGFNLPYADVMSLYCQGVVFDDIETSLESVRLTNPSADEFLLTMRDWQPRRQIWITSSITINTLKNVDSRSQQAGFRLAENLQFGSEFSVIISEPVSDPTMVVMATKGHIGLPPPNFL